MDKTKPNRQKLIILIAVSFLLVGNPQSASNNQKLDSAPDLSQDKPALQRGAKLFINYCLGCHSAKAVRFNTLEKIGYSQEVIYKNLLFVGDGIYDLMKITTKTEDAKKWFGIFPPDLSTAARVRSADWIYTFLRSYYLDNKSTHGFNNTVYPNTSMPNVFWQLQGIQTKQNNTLSITKEGKISQEEFDRSIAELTAFINWISDPTKSERYKIGYFVIAFMLLMVFLTYKLKKEFWQDVK